MAQQSEHEQVKKKEPTVAPGMEMDELDRSATPEEIRKGESTSVTKLYRDFVD
ncbi:hypothetical protein [Brevibacillus marinus]|jgi:hypothetical protein|uniref:hypothetical protein n=1 Tax=Brevibacillus marinus TaxID=2496837 RepID=UPI0013DFA124|nr:hypothetical protein [Brevibacillus marinus]